jgi:hypothetical protein
MSEHSNAEHSCGGCLTPVKHSARNGAAAEKERKRYQEADVSSTAAASSEYDFSPGLPLVDRSSRVRHARRAFTRYLIAICTGVAATLAWQSYGDVIKQTVATKAPELGWSPEAQQLIATSVQQLGWTKAAELEKGVPATTATETAQQAPVARVAADPAASNPSASASPTLEQMQQMASDLAALKQAVEQLSGNQNQMAQDIAKVQATDQEVLNKVSANKVVITNPNNKIAATKASALPPAMPTHRHQSPPLAPIAAPAPSAPPPPLLPQRVPLR